MDNNHCEETLNELKKFIVQREEIIKVLEDGIDKYIVDRTLPFSYKERYVEWQQELLDLAEVQLNAAKEFMNSLL
ncbi:hypothetical protein CHL78_007980 [Romboutsia weinsteinii]|uniref:Uncharacterized protein n=1 Tax=Romboutsia weinsteinii TaxID=2020949 RepID=A0A371J5H0_9FIRM|nr:hypothetical protein [Romboutsia weinsteinii]RDY27933.1 hypothetical protein CHL78_007980 [Romboutsia weinsteinii]